MLIVADSSALVALATCDALELLAALYDDVKVPQAVFDEVTISGKLQFPDSLQYKSSGKNA